MTQKVVCEDHKRFCRIFYCLIDKWNVSGRYDVLFEKVKNITLVRQTEENTLTFIILIRFQDDDSEVDPNERATWLDTRDENAQENLKMLLYYNLLEVM